MSVGVQTGQSLETPSTFYSLFFFCLRSSDEVSPCWLSHLIQKKALLLLLDLMLVCCLRKARDRMEGIRYLPNEVIKGEFLAEPETSWNNASIKAHNCSTLLYSNTLQFNSGSVDLCLIPLNQSKEGPSSVQMGLHQVSTRSCIQK